MFLLPLGYLPSLVCCIENLFHTHSCSNILLLCMANFYLNFECGVDNTLRASLKFLPYPEIIDHVHGSQRNITDFSFSFKYANHASYHFSTY